MRHPQFKGSLQRRFWREPFYRAYAISPENEHLKWALPHFISSSKLPCPYIWRMIFFRGFTWLSTWPLLHSQFNATFTAISSCWRPTAKWRISDGISFEIASLSQPARYSILWLQTILKWKWGSKIDRPWVWKWASKIGSPALLIQVYRAWLSRNPLSGISLPIHTIPV